jgi:predicted MFS family arabinose efflux permease
VGALGWRDAFLWLGVLSVVAVLPLLVWTARLRPGVPVAAGPDSGPHGVGGANGAGGANGPSRLRTALSTPRIWLLFAVYALCGFHDFFVATHIVAFALDHGMSAELSGNMLAFMGLMGLVGVLLTGAACDRLGPVRPAAACFVLRIALFGAILVSQHTAVILVVALLFGATFWITAPLTVVFVRDGYGTALLGTLAGMVTMVHHACGGLGAYVGAASFDLAGGYGPAFAIMLATSALALVLILALPRTRGALPEAPAAPAVPTGER